LIAESAPALVSAVVLHACMFSVVGI
jgi:hypothetical protein